MIYRFLIVLSLMPLSVWASLPEKLEQLNVLFDPQTAIETFDIRDIQSNFPAELIAGDSMWPQTVRYPIRDLQALYRLADSCVGRFPLSPLTTEALVFTRAICNGTQLPERWFARSSLIHPGGGSYAARFVEIHPDTRSWLEKYMHVSERETASGGVLKQLQSLDDDGAEALLAGASLIAQPDVVWVRKGDDYEIYPISQLVEHADQLDLLFERVIDVDSCLISQGNLCWSEDDNVLLLQGVLVALVALNLVLVAAWALYQWDNKRKEMRARMLILQILTHELRTPIASLSLTVEGFRREFESLPESVYDEFRRLCEDSRRLRQLAEASKDYLQSDNQVLASEWLPSLRDWMVYKQESFDAPVEVHIKDDRAVKVNIYWLGTCIDNLVRNAIKYGEAPVKISMNVSDGKLFIVVEDQGELSHRDWQKLKQPFVSKSGLGLGLTIVDAMVKRMGGRLKLIGPPTQFILEIPCESDTATG